MGLFYTSDLYSTFYGIGFGFTFERVKDVAKYTASLFTPLALAKAKSNT